ncbi:hypothetical protein H6P81_020193 [Aristolochia fimbriata]|uniref:GH10 domain-containing protein n=1 Tax=Aristolochia fimbriata TaxID=158543 RepID=A0AAV7DYA8_ARIFI|nr:hypothetical protein H6P81_020193 [Aristolochia fimbriata]
MNIDEEDHAENIILNHDFAGGLDPWKPNCCDSFVVFGQSSNHNGVKARTGTNFAVVTNRGQCWQGLEQDITSRVSLAATYTVSASVRVWAASLEGDVDVRATLRLEYPDAATEYLFVGSVLASKDCWKKLDGRFSLEKMPRSVVFYLEGPSPGIDLLIDSVVVASLFSSKERKETCRNLPLERDENILLNPYFENGLANWTARGCRIALQDCFGDGKLTPLHGKFFASATNRTQQWNGIQQEITARVKQNVAYEVKAGVRISGGITGTVKVEVTLWVQKRNQREEYIRVGTLQTSDKEWMQLQGKFFLCGPALRVIIYVEGSPAGTDILLDHMVIKPAAKIRALPPHVIKNCEFGVNVIQNSNLQDGLKGWFPLGPCTLSVAAGSPRMLPLKAIESLEPHETLSGFYLSVTNRTQNWMGPAQMITDKIHLYLTYQVSAWVRIGSRTSGLQHVNVAIDVEGKWVNGGQIEICDDSWHEIGGSFRIEKKPSKVMVYVQGPSPGVDLMVAGLHIFPVDLKARFKHLKMKTDKVRKRDVIIKLLGLDGSIMSGATVKVQQNQNSFPFGSCISRRAIDNEIFVRFLVENFNWAVLENELKWPSTEPQQGKLNYKDVDDLLNFCKSHNLKVRGHCLFWEVEDTVPSWVRLLNKNDLKAAIENRLVGLLSRYKGKFHHYDVNNEMLHGSFHQDRLGKEIRAYMFKITHQLDPNAVLFVNDYHVEDGCDHKSSPEKYIEHILGLQEQGAPVGGIGLQGHIDSPVGSIVCSALDKMAILSLPIWFTELDVSSTNEHVRADDLEVMLREAFAHPAVEGITLWGFCELLMSRENAHLLEADGNVTEAGKRYLALREEWLTQAHGQINDKREFEFRGFYGSYDVEVGTPAKTFTQKFVVDEGEGQLYVYINL